MRKAYRWLDYRLREAALTLRCLKYDRHDVPAGYGSYWPGVVRSAKDAYGYDGDPVYGDDPEHPLIQQDTAEQKRRREENINRRVLSIQRGRIDRLDEVLAWLWWLSPGERRIVWGRAAGRSWEQLKNGASIRTLQRQRDRALETLLVKLMKEVVGKNNLLWCRVLRQNPGNL